MDLEEDLEVAAALEGQEEVAGKSMSWFRL